ncbi:hypothetical protein HanRHA438_Chr02g0054111 [Helianthus annuus]|nr:hypothetical protein HanRHA438_Chr02g0054111 [Helianthus annuus]
MNTIPGHMDATDDFVPDKTRIRRYIKQSCQNVSVCIKLKNIRIHIFLFVIILRRF